MVRTGLRGDGRTVGRAGARRTAGLLIAAEVAAAIALVTGALLLARSFTALQRVDVGVDVDRLLAFDLVLSGDRAAAHDARVDFYERVLERLRAIPGVAAAGMAVTLPIGGDSFGAPIVVDGAPLPPQGQDPTAGYQMVSPGFFAAAGVPLVAGRDVSIDDTRQRPLVAVVNESFAAAHWPGQSALGRRFRLGRSATAAPIEVVGIVRDLRHFGPDAPARPEFYQPYSQSSFSFMAVVVRAHGDPGALAGPVREAVASLDPSQPVSGLTTMAEHLRNDLAQPRFLSLLTSLFGGLALTLAAVGLYGVLSASVASRTRELGVQLALGAQRGRLIRGVLAEGLKVVLAGIVVGTLVAIAVGSGLRAQLHEVSPNDPWTYVAAAVAVIVVALTAMAAPAYRATRVDPIRALRAD